jgi:hypothetical protein
MKISWKTGLDEVAKSDVEKAFKGGSLLRQRLCELCEAKIQASLSVNNDQYDSPNWAYIQADNIGYRKALKEIISLLSD